jgi:hypothetical protein
LGPARVHYYTGFLGMSDTITTQDLLTPDDRTSVERERDHALR